MRGSKVTVGGGRSRRGGGRGCPLLRPLRTGLSTRVRPPAASRQASRCPSTSHPGWLASPRLSQPTTLDRFRQGGHDVQSSRSKGPFGRGPQEVARPRACVATCSTISSAESGNTNEGGSGRQSLPAGRGDPLDDLKERLLNSPFRVFVKLFMRWQPPKWTLRSGSAVILAGQVILRIAQGKIHWRNTIEQLRIVGPNSLGVCLLTASFVGMVFTIQFTREFTKLGLTRSIGGVLALALARELIPVITSIILAGRVGSAFAAELGTMQVSQQTDTLRVLQTDPVDYLVTPRVLACLVALPVLVVLCFGIGMAASVLLADGVYEVSANIMLDSAQRTLAPWDVVSSLLKSVVFGFIISVVSCSWGYTTTGGAKGVGESTTSAVVISLVGIFIADFVLSYMFFQGQGDALAQLV